MEAQGPNTLEMWMPAELEVLRTDGQKLSTNHIPLNLKKAKPAKLAKLALLFKCLARLATSLL